MGLNNSAVRGAGAETVEGTLVRGAGAGTVEGLAVRGAGAETVEGPGSSENTSNRVFFSSAFIVTALAVLVLFVRFPDSALTDI